MNNRWNANQKIEKTLIGMNGDKPIHAVEISPKGLMVIIDNNEDNKQLLGSVINHCPYIQLNEDVIQKISKITNNKR